MINKALIFDTYTGRYILKNEAINSMIDANVYIPTVKRVIFNVKKAQTKALRDANGELVIDKTTGKPKRVSTDLLDPKHITKIEFDDGTYVIVKCSAKDTPSKDNAIAYGIIKRLYGKVTATGEVVGDGVGIFIQKLIDNAWDQPTMEKKIAEDKARAKAENEAKQKSIQEAAKEKRIKKLVRNITDMEAALAFLKQQPKENEHECNCSCNSNYDDCNCKSQYYEEYDDYVRPDKKFKDFTQEEKREYWRWQKRK